MMFRSYIQFTVSYILFCQNLIFNPNILRTVSIQPTSSSSVLLIFLGSNPTVCQLLNALGPFSSLHTVPSARDALYLYFYPSHESIPFHSLSSMSQPKYSTSSVNPSFPIYVSFLCKLVCTLRTPYFFLFHLPYLNTRMSLSIWCFSNKLTYKAPWTQGSGHLSTAQNGVFNIAGTQ